MLLLSCEIAAANGTSWECGEATSNPLIPNEVPKLRFGV
jgi:hypothetical protein